MSILVRNEQRKLFASYLNSIASGTAIGGTLPLFAAWALGTSQSIEAPVFLMLIAFSVSATILSFALRLLKGLEDPL
jgi:ABC-type multidrug transport system permease subunit